MKEVRFLIYFSKFFDYDIADIRSKDDVLLNLKEAVTLFLSKLVIHIINFSHDVKI